MNKICKVCKGRCCRQPMITENEVKRIEQEIGRKIKTQKVTPRLFKFVNKKCEFNQNGCILKNKPLACWLYPFLLTKWGWVLRISCPYWNKFTKEDLKSFKIQFKKRKADWIGT